MEWEQVSPGLSSLVLRQQGAAMLRCVSVELPEARLVIGPIKGASEAAQSAVADRPVWLLAPNQYHNMGLKRWSERHSAPIFGGAPAVARLQKMAGAPVLPSAQLAERLPAGVSLMEPPGTRTGEVWVRREGADGVTWIVGDAFFCVPDPLPDTFEGWFLYLTSGGPPPAIGQSFLWLALADRRRYREWLLERLEADRPARLIPMHGEPLAGPDLAARLRAVAERRL